MWQIKICRFPMEPQAVTFALLHWAVPDALQALPQLFKALPQLFKVLLQLFKALLQLFKALLQLFKALLLVVQRYHQVLLPWRYPWEPFCCVLSLRSSKFPRPQA